MCVIHMDDQLKTLQSWINESSYTVAVTGAGVSVTAGIPDPLLLDGIIILQSVTGMRQFQINMVHFVFFQRGFQS